MKGVATSKYRDGLLSHGFDENSKEWRYAARAKESSLSTANGRDNVSIVHVRAHAGEMGNEVADVLAKEGAEFDGAYEVARNHKYMDAISAALLQGGEPQHRSVPRRRRGRRIDE